MAEKNMKARIVHKHDTEARWSQVTNFIPKKGEVVVYDIDNNHSYERIKIGDGGTSVNQLPFVDDALRASLSSEIAAVDDKIGVISGQIVDHNTSKSAHSDIRTAVSDVSDLVGTKAVSVQINEAISNLEVITNDEIDAICSA